MSHTTEADYKKQIEDLRELHRQAVESAQQAVEETLKAHDQCCSDLCYYNTGNYYATIEDRTNG